VNRNASNNTFIGAGSGQSNTRGHSNTYLGKEAGMMDSSGIHNTFVGTYAGTSTTSGSGCVLLGYEAGYDEMGSNKLYIANGRNAEDILIYGDFTTGRIGLGTLSPQRKLHVVRDGPRILIEGSTGNPEVNFKTAGDSPADIWAIYKHSVAKGLRFYQNGDRLTIQDNTGNVGIGTTDPAAKLDVYACEGSIVTAVTGHADKGPGVVGTSSTAFGIRGESESFHGVSGMTNSHMAGVYGYSEGVDGTGVRGDASSGPLAYGIWGVSTSGYAGYFSGNTHVNGTLSKTAGGFKIDHPLDPEHKYLYHSFVESFDMMNMYNGNVLLDGAGEAWVELPTYFEALNRDFRYQLTAIGAPAPNLHVAEKVPGNRFKISGGVPGMEVSWQVTGIRKDVYAEAHRIAVEVDKEPENQGRYLNPEERGKPEEPGIGWEKVQSTREMEARLKDKQAAMSTMPGRERINAQDIKAEKA
jgi:hypothetical protein